MIYPYPFPGLVNLDLHLPDYAKYLHQDVIWDREINQDEFRVKYRKKTGIYIWFENHHNTNKVLYVGQSGNILKRIEQHHHETRNNSNPISISPVLKYLSERPYDNFEPCALYPDNCDCIPRHFIVVLSMRNLNYQIINRLEKDLIILLNPLLNKYRPICQLNEITS